MMPVGYVQILYALLYGGLEHPWILVSVMGGILEPVTPWVSRNAVESFMTLFLPSQSDAFYFLFLPIAVVPASNAMPESSARRGHPCVGPDLGEKTVRFSLLRMTLAVGCSRRSLSH